MVDALVAYFWALVNLNLKFLAKCIGIIELAVLTLLLTLSHQIVYFTQSFFK